MVISKITKTYFKRSYLPCNTNNTTKVTSIDLRCTHGFSKIISIDCHKEIVEIPMLYFNPILDTIKREQHGTVSIPLYITKLSNKAESFSEIIKDCCTKVDYDIRLKNHVLNDASTNYPVYYVGKGLILDESFTPILYLAVNYSVKESKVLDLLCYINPVIYIREDTFLKGIRTKYLPFLATNKMEFVTGNYYMYSDEYPVTIILKEFEDKFQKPTPIINTANNKALNTFLKNNKEELIFNLNLV